MAADRLARNAANAALQKEAQTAAILAARNDTQNRRDYLLWRLAHMTPGAHREPYWAPRQHWAQTSTEKAITARLVSEKAQRYLNQLDRHAASTAYYSARNAELARQQREAEAVRRAWMTRREVYGYN